MCIVAYSYIKIFFILTPIAYVVNYIDYITDYRSDVMGITQVTRLLHEHWQFFVKLKRFRSMYAGFSICFHVALWCFFINM